jgi:hypothetical protein
VYHAIRNSIRHVGAYASVTGKNIFEMFKKFERKFSRLHMDILCVHIKFYEKPTFFVTCVKKTKKTPHVDDFLHQNLVLYTGH